VKWEISFVDWLEILKLLSDWETLRVRQKLMAHFSSVLSGRKK
jgi:hypothetical protein